jgi:hypothetical protein
VIIFIQINAQEILPFSIIKIINDSIYFTLIPGNDKWHKLLSIDSIGSDAILKYSKDNYGLSKCDYEIECYKFNIISNFDKIYSKMQNRIMPARIGLEYEFDNKVQNGVDVECTNEKYKNTQKMIEENIKLSKDNIVITKIGNSLLKGFNRLKKTFSQIFSEKTKINHNSINKKEEKNLRKDIYEIKIDVKNLIQEEEKIEKVFFYYNNRIYFKIFKK